jgi:hypothetical protein
MCKKNKAGLEALVAEACHFTIGYLSRFFVLLNTND